MQDAEKAAVIAKMVEGYEYARGRTDAFAECLVKVKASGAPPEVVASVRQAGLRARAERDGFSYMLRDVTALSKVKDGEPEVADGATDNEKQAAVT